MSLEAILSGDTRAVARAATAIENGKARDLPQQLLPHTGRATIIGITGAPGAGKSTLVDQMALVFRQQGKRVAILAVDPTSPYTGGAILGDRVRMLRHYADPGVFIRSMATRGCMGGIARATSDVAKLLDAAGFEIVLIETVGVGQDEVEVARLADVTVVVLVPGMGDDVQAIKAGLMEIADVFVINKSDHPGADRIEREIKAEHPDRPIIRTVATEAKGTHEVVAAAVAQALSVPRRLSSRGLSPASAIKLDHIGIAVRSVNQAIQFYSDQLGLTVAQREAVDQEKVNLAMLPTGESRIELLEPAAPDSVIAKFLEKRGEGLHHIAIRVPDLTATLAGLRAAGARLLNEPRKGAGGHTYVFVHPASSNGVLLELIQE